MPKRLLQYAILLLALVSLPSMATISYVGGSSTRGNGSPGNNRHNQTILANDLVIAYVNVAGVGPITPQADSGAPWTEVVDENPAGTSAQHAFYWKVANANEPANMFWDHPGGGYQIHVRVFRSTELAWFVDAAGKSHIQTGSQTQSILAGAADGETISANALSLIQGGKDARKGAPDDYVSADNSYVEVLGAANNQATASAHRIYTAGTVFAGDIEMNVATSADGLSAFTYSVHMSFVDTDVGPPPGPDLRVLRRRGR